MKYLKLFSAELYREYIELKRYPFELLVSSFIFSLIFVIAYMMAEGFIRDTGIDLANKQVQHNVANMFVGYLVWMYSFLVMGAIPQSIRNDVSSGLLEQVLLSPFSAGTIILARTAAETISSILPIVMTGGFMAFFIETNFIFDPLGISVVLALLSVGSVGVGLILGAFSLVFKRTSMLTGVVIWSTSLLVAANYNQSGIQGIFMRLFPTSQGIRLFRISMVEGLSLKEMVLSAEIFYLAAGSLLFLITGFIIFNLFDKIARRFGLLGQY